MSDNEIINPELAQCEVHGMTRSAFILRGALAAGAVYGTTAVAPFVSQALAAEESGDVGILNFALTLEYLEADFYNVKGKSLALSAAIKQLGGKPVAKPTFVFPATSEKTFLALASVLENTGVGAYNGAAPSLKSKQVLASAGSIVQIEARHAAAIDLLIGKSPTPNEGFDKPLMKAEVLSAVKPLIKA